MQSISSLPGPTGNSITGNLTELGRNPLKFLTKCRTEYGDIIPLRLPFIPAACLITNPDYIEQILKDKNLFVKSKGLRALKSLIGEGILSSEGDDWQRQRRLIQPVFYQKRIAVYGQIMVAYTEQMLATWKDGEIRDIHEDMMRLTLNIVMKCLFNQDVSEGEAEKVAHALDVSMQWFENKRKQGFFIWEWFPRPENIRYANAIKEMDKSIYKIIAQRRSTGENPGDLLSMLMEAKYEEDGSQMSDKQLRDEMATLMLAGHETTANSLSWIWMLLLQHPEVQNKLLAEIEEVLGDRSPTVADIPKLPYTSMVVNEAMRLYPPVPLMAREASKECEIGGYQIPAGCYIILSQWVMHRHPSYFESPEEFQPERWANDLEKRLPRGVFFPFGDGPRVCIGKSFALMEAVLILATTIQKVAFDLVPDNKIVPQASITLRPESGIKISVRKR